MVVLLNELVMVGACSCGIEGACDGGGTCGGGGAVVGGCRLEVAML